MNGLKKGSSKISAARRLLLALLLTCLLSFSAGTIPALAAKRIKPIPGAIPVVPAAFIFQVSLNGIYRVTYEEMRAAGLDLSGVVASDIALTNRGASVPVFIQSERQFGPGAFIEFYGQALDTLYSRTNVYQILINRKLASRVLSVNAAPTGDTPLAFYMEKVIHAENNAYNVSSPKADPWYHTAMAVYTTPKTWDFAAELDNYLPEAAPVSLSVDIYGSTEVSLTPDHHVQVQLNGQSVADVFFDGLNRQTINAGNLSALPGVNTLSITLPGNSGAPYDGVVLESYTLSYPRAPIARQGRLEMTVTGPSIKATGFDYSEIVAYRLSYGILERLSNIEVSSDEQGYAAAFAGSSLTSTYFISNAASLLHPLIMPSRTPVDISSGSANYIMISHPAFIDGLAPLVQARQAQGYTVRVVNVDDIYTQYNFGIYDPQAISNYIKHAKANMGVQYILLVGGDSYDYHNYLGLGQLSYIPTPYAATDRIARFSPVDPLYADVNGDNVPDLALGRLPVRDAAQLSVILAKTLTYQAKTYHSTSVFASDKNFSIYTNIWAAALPAEWSKQFAGLDQLLLTDARKVVIDNMNAGTALVNYFGHSTPTMWTSSGLFSNSDVPNLTNVGKPFVVTQYGCWNSYFVNPKQDSLGQQFLYASDRGAAAVVGSTTNNYSLSQFSLGQYLTPNLATPGMTIGWALHTAKQSLAANQLYYPEIMLGWSILGDPALVIAP